MKQEKGFNNICPLTSLFSASVVVRNNPCAYTNNQKIEWAASHDITTHPQSRIYIAHLLMVCIHRPAMIDDDARNQDMCIQQYLIHTACPISIPKRRLPNLDLFQFNQLLQAINAPTFVTFCWVVTELRDFKLWKIGQNVHTNMEGFRRDSHIYTKG